MTATDERPLPPVLPAGPGHGIAANANDPPQPGQFVVFEESEDLSPNLLLADPAVQFEEMPHSRFGSPLAAASLNVTATKVLNEARSHLGFIEGRDNGNPFWVWDPADPWLKNASYCASAASYCFWHIAGRAGLGAVYGGAYNCAAWVATFQRHSRFYRSGRRGDLVFYDWSGAKRAAVHVGVVESIDAAGNVTAVEFNALPPGGSGDQGNGGGCYRRTRGTWCIVGYGRPVYAPEGNITPTPPDPSSTKLVLSVDGVWGPTTTRRMQQWLGAAADGQLGPGTRKALQRALGVTADGVWGPGTRKALQRAVGVPQDGVWGPQTIKALQRYLNAAPVRRVVKATDTTEGTDTEPPPEPTTELVGALITAILDRLVGAPAASTGRHAR